MRHVERFLISGIALALSGCISLGDNEHNPSTTYEQTIHKEVAELLKSYRMCLQKNEEFPQKAKDNCTAYHDAIQDLAPSETKHSIGAFLDRMLRKDREREHN